MTESRWTETERQFGPIPDHRKRFCLLWSTCPVCTTGLQFVDGFQECASCGWSERLLTELEKDQ